MTKNVVLSKECYNLLSMLNQDFNVFIPGKTSLSKGVTPPDEYYNPLVDGYFNPFGTPDYWVEIQKFKVKKINWRIGGRKFEQNYLYTKLITKIDFEKFDAHVEYDRFLLIFLIKLKITL